MSFGALGVLGLGMYLTFARPDLFTYSLICLAVGFIMTQIGMYLGVRYGRSPRPDQKLDAALKGLHSDFNIYHYITPASHLLVGPSGIWTLHPLHQGGKISFEKNRWRARGGGFFQAYMRIFGQEGLGRPDFEADGEVRAAGKFFDKKMEGVAVPEIKPILVFTNEQVELEAGGSPIPAMRLKELKEFLRQGAKTRILSSAQIAEINARIQPE